MTPYIDTSSKDTATIRGRVCTI